MIRMAVVGDLSMQDPDKLDKVLAAAFADADIIVQVGDVHSGGYDVVNKYLKVGKPFFIIPGNHDIEWDRLLALPRQWRHDIMGIRLVGLDNSQDTLCDKDYEILNGLPDDNMPLFVFAHKPLSTIVLPDGTESNHIMGDGSTNHDCEKLKQWLGPRKEILICGHYHGWTYMRTSYSDVLVEGRGGAAPQLGYSIFIIQPEGWVIHPVNL